MSASGREQGPKYYNEANRRIFEATIKYFNEAREPGSRRNVEAARLLLNQVGGAATLAGFALVAEGLEKVGRENVRDAIFRSTSDSDLDSIVFAASRLLMGQLKDLVIAEGTNKAGERLLASLVATPDEDEKALMAYMLTMGFESGFDLTTLSRELSKIMLNNIYEDITGTSCKMALAWLLYKLGNTKQWTDLVYGNHFVRLDYVNRVENTLAQKMPKVKKNELRAKMLQELGVSGSTDLPTYMFRDRMGVLEYLSLDIASNGQAFRGNPYWVRKPKE